MTVDHARPINMTNNSNLSYCFRNYNIKTLTMQDKTIPAIVQTHLISISLRKNGGLCYGAICI